MWFIFVATKYVKN